MTTNNPDGSPRLTLIPGGADGDAEAVPVDAAGQPVDADSSPPPAVLADGARPPVIPTWLRSAADRRHTVARAADLAGYTVAFHAVRSPKYLAKTLYYAPKGALATVGRLLHWASAERGNFELRQHAATSGDAFTWQALNRTRSKESRGRWWTLGLGAFALLITVMTVGLSEVVPSWAWWAGAAALVPLAARAGRPADVPITDRVSAGKRFTKLTGEMVRDALVSLNLSGLKEPGAVEFVQPGIHRDGPGWLARVNLPAGLEAVKVLERRGSLSSALRLPVDQVWPAVGPQHAGQLDLWVGYQPASKMGAPPWPLLAARRISVFDPIEPGFDARMRAVTALFMETNWLIGGQPGSGKTYGARSLALIAAMDPCVELKIAAFKPSGDFADLAPLCSTYVCGIDDAAFEAGADIIAWAEAEVMRRGRRIAAARERGHAPDGKVTRELAERPGSGLHPVVIILDEVHELLAQAKAIGERLARVIRLARAFGITFVLATQVADANSVPSVITRCVSVRWCMSVRDHTANDMILGTGAYKSGLTATAFRPRIDAGWGVLTGADVTGHARAWYPTPEQVAKVIAKAAALRGRVVGTPIEEKTDARDVLTDVRAVFASGEAGLPWKTIAERLADLLPDPYGGTTGDMVRESLARFGVTSQDVKVAGSNLKGARRTAIDAAIAQRDTDNDADAVGDGAAGRSTA
ncbi:cell division protein FtsK [Pilimelia terevasa]|uniref:Cell division protein FtsK n=1 Tax=Pilimelia terevasa TaxID=53372 RepID=A0A8J3BML5_9ACTN|nr:cell division protein FtsK [Pilimelia terevasa]GGK32499.1 cell division protein FtsK [Pilimelia terevasa]